MRRIERALISVYDKTGIVEFARSLTDLGVEIVSTGGTSRLLGANGIKLREVSDLTGFPEILDGRVKTLNPRIAGGLLAVRENAEHMKQISEHKLPLIDLVCVNLYPFAETIRKPDVQFQEAIENIDVGGPAMIRAAAKNFQDVAIVTSPDDYAHVAESLRQGSGVLPHDILLQLARKAFLCTARARSPNISRMQTTTPIFLPTSSWISKRSWICGMAKIRISVLRSTDGEDSLRLE